MDRGQVRHDAFLTGLGSRPSHLSWPLSPCIPTDRLPPVLALVLHCTLFPPLRSRGTIFEDPLGGLQPIPPLPLSFPGGSVEGQEHHPANMQLKQARRALGVWAGKCPACQESCSLLLVSPWESPVPWLGSRFSTIKLPDWPGPRVLQAQSWVGSLSAGISCWRLTSNASALVPSLT